MPMQPGDALLIVSGFGLLLALGAFLWADRPSRERWRDARRRNPVPQHRERWWVG